MFFSNLSKYQPLEAWRVGNSLRRHGFAVIEFPDEAITERAAAIREFLDANLDRKTWEAGGKADMRCSDAWSLQVDIKAIATNAAVTDLLSKIYGRQAFPFQTLNFLAGSEQAAHVDLVHFSAKPHRFMCGVWLGLEDISAEAGPLAYYPGSHKWPVITPETLGLPLASPGYPYEHYHLLEEAWGDQRSRYGAQAQHFTPKVGQALIWDANLMHGGSPHRDRAQTRLSQVTHYFFEGCEYYTPLTGEARAPVPIAA